ncbi:hypothetical protein Tco_0025396, partial [Tanacetum coccineum]
EAQSENEDFINKLDDNIKKIIKDQVKEQVKAQVSKILPKIEKTVNEQLEAEVLTHSSNESKTSYVVAANLSELKLKKILIDKMESNKSIHRSDEQKNLYKALIDAYESDKLILDTYGDTILFKIHRDDEDKDKEPSAGSNRGSKRRRDGKEPKLTSPQKEKTSMTIGKSTEGSNSHHKSAQVEEPMHTAEDLEELAHREFITGDTKDKPDEETSQLPDWESARDVYSKRRIIASQSLNIRLAKLQHLDWLIYSHRRHAASSCSRQVDKSHRVESYQKKLNLTKPDTYRPDLKRREAYTAYSNPRDGVSATDYLETSDKDKAVAMNPGNDQTAKDMEDYTEFEKICYLTNVNNREYIKSPNALPYDFARTSE